MNETVNLTRRGSSPSGMKELDFLIIGQGISGTFLSYFLRKAGKNILVIDEDKPFTASKVASGVINPVTGRRIVRTWRIEELLPFALNAFKDFGALLGINIVKELSIIEFHPSVQMKEAFEKRLTEEAEYLQKTNGDDWMQFFNFYNGAGKVNPCLLIDINPMLNKWRERLQLENILLNERFCWDSCTIYNDRITYKDITAKKIIFCDGVAGIENPYFKNLPYAVNKGEAIIARIPTLSQEYIYKQGLSIVPWKEDLFWIGSSYEWNFTNVLPTKAFKDKVTQQLSYWLKLPFEIIDHIASVRPANMERRPFVGLHPLFCTVGILNGLGTKGCSLAPFFANQLTDYLVEGKPIYADADVKRFEKTLARKMD